MISHKHKCIFVQVPKTGSTSIRAILGRPIRPHLNLWEIKLLLENYWPVRGGRKDRLLESFYMLVPRHKRVARGHELFKNYFKFGFVRNPWDRVVSLYERREGVELRNSMSFDQFVDWIQYSSATCIHSSPHRYQLDWFVDPNGHLLADFIGRFERLEQDWAFVANKLGITAPLPHRRSNPRARHYTEYYNDRTREIVARKFQADVETFGYQFE